VLDKEFGVPPGPAAGLYALRAPSPVFVSHYAGSRPAGNDPSRKKTQLEILGRKLGIETTGESPQSLEKPETLRYEQV